MRGLLEIQAALFLVHVFERAVDQAAEVHDGVHEQQVQACQVRRGSGHKAV